MKESLIANEVHYEDGYSWYVDEGGHYWYCDDEVPDDFPSVIVAPLDYIEVAE